MGPVIIDFSGFQNDVLKSLATEFLMGRIPYFTENHSGDLRLFVAIDGLQKIFGKKLCFPAPAEGGKATRDRDDLLLPKSCKS